jgi:hypothetical protein
MTSSFSRQPSGRLGRNRSRRSGDASTAAFVATSRETAASRRRKRRCLPMPTKSQHCCEPGTPALEFRERLLGINPALSCVCVAELSPSSVRV